MKDHRGEFEQLPPRWSIALAGLFLVALAWRLMLVARVARTPLFDALESDAATYWAWSGILRAHGPVGANPFFLAPLYPYALAFLRSITGDSILNVLVVQAFIGALAAPLIADASRRLTTPAIGLGAGVIAAGYSMSALYGMLVLPECLLFTLGAGLVWLLVAWPWEKRTLSGAGTAGVLIGVMALGRATFLVLVIPVATLLIGRMRPMRMICALAVTVGVIAALAAPVGLRHRAIVHEWIPYTYSLGYNVYIGNGPLADGMFVPMRRPALNVPDESLVEGGILGDGRDLIAIATGRQVGPSESSDYWFKESVRTMAAQPIRAARLWVFKSALLLNHREIPQIEDPVAYGIILGPLGIPVLGTFAFIGAFGLAGAERAVWRGRRERALVAYVIGLVIATSVFFVTARYRVHIVPGLLPLAAVAFADLRAALHSRDLLGVGRLGVALVPTCVLVALPLLPRDSARDQWSAAEMLGEAWLRHREPKRALAELDRAVAIDRSGRMLNAETRVARETRAFVYQVRGMALLELGDEHGARGSFEMADRLSPGDPAVLVPLGQLHAVEGDIGSAKAIFARVDVPPAEAARLFIERAVAQDRAGDRNRAQTSLRAAVVLDPHAEAAWVGLVRLFVTAGRADSALTVLDRARSAGMDPNVYAAHRVLIAVAANRGADERAWRSRISGWAVSDPRVRATLELARASER